MKMAYCILCESFVPAELLEYICNMGFRYRGGEDYPVGLCFETCIHQHYMSVAREVLRANAVSDSLGNVDE